MTAAETIREWFVEARVSPPSGSGPGCTHEQANAEFDRWLAEHDAETRRKALEEAEAAVRPATFQPAAISNSALHWAADRIHLLIKSETRP